MSKQILVLANNSDGLYGFRKELLTALAKNSELYASTPDNGYFESLHAIGCHILETMIDRRGINPLTDFSLFVRYLRMIKRIRPDLVITYTIKPNIYGGLSCRLLDIPYAANITGLGTAFQKSGALRTLVSTMYRFSLKKARVVFFENAGNMETLLNEGIVNQNQCKLLPGAGVNLEHYAFSEYPTEEMPIRFLFMGRVMREKGVDELFEAMHRLQQEDIPCTLDVLGGCEEHYEETLRRCEAEGLLRYHGYQKDVRPFIRDCHCFVLPSWHEGMANTNLECAAMGRPLITSRIHGCMEAVVEGESGLLCEPKNADSLHDAMARFCHMPPAQRAAMGIAGRRHMEETFDRQKVVAETIERII